MAKNRKGKRQLAKQIDSLLSKLPGDGDKTVLSLALKALLPVLIVQFPALAPALPILLMLADAGLTTGLIHKIVKLFSRKDEP